MLGLGNSLSRGGVLSGFENKYSLEFDGSDDYVDLGDISDLEFSGSQGWTISMWIYPNVVNAYQGLMNKRSGAYGFIFQLTDGAVLQLDTGDGSSLTSSNTSTTISANEWTHVVVSRPATATGTIDFYKNGSLMAMDTDNTHQSHAAATSANAYIGIHDDASSRVFNGNIDEVAIWDVALDADAVSAIYNSGTPIALDADLGNYDNSSDLVSWWRMGDGVLDDFDLIADQVNPTLGSELLNNGDFATGDLTGWTVADEWSDDDDGVIYQDGGVRFRSGGDSILISQSILTSGKVYKVVLECTSYTSGNWYTRGGNFYAQGNSGAGTHTNYLLASGSDFIINRDTGGIPHDFILDNISVKQVNGNPGIMTNMASDDIVEDTP